MKPWVVLVVLAVLAIVVFALKRRGLPADTSGPWPFYVKRPMSVPEQVLYHRLVKALPEHIVMPQVQVSRVLGVKQGVNFHHWNNRVNRLSYDFVVCGKDASVLAAIELDDRSHERPQRVRADEKKNRASEGAGLRVIRWNVRALPDESAIRLELFAARNDKAEDTPAARSDRATIPAPLDALKPGTPIAGKAARRLG